MVITLTGMPGSGKTTVGRILADLLGCRFLDLDDEIVRSTGRSIPSIFAEEGEAAFRKIEARTLRSVVPAAAKESPVPTLVLALGGGTVLKPGSARLVHDDTVCVWLRATEETLLARLADTAAGRPLLAADRPQSASERPSGPDSDAEGHAPDDGSGLAGRIARLMEERSAVYADTAHVILDTDGCSPEDVASEIIVTIL